ncbi:polyamine aminopropyltransferase [Bacillus benzoevorans]|uniref:Polyamine aminopropyltransferase n=1 Tax=Bacillus benzoevorans TaxID=1456 RepID=A0A7X0LV94_9BACI|nr:polyamine aminopropyltransferase [Bacillus benzoevorans]MBB6445378.1 spermidine synthase [Bacillus benzoevorans]
MAKERSLYGFHKENSTVWIRNFVGNARIEQWYKIHSLLHYEKSTYQEISIVESKGFGRMLVLDGTPQNSMKEGFIYNEMISHIPLVTHPHPKKVAMIGGGDCGPARETMKYKEVEQIDVVELDPKVTELCRKYLTPASAYENETRLTMIHEDGYDWIQKQKDLYDILMIDRPDPVGPGTKLFSKEFYQAVYDGLTDDGIVVFQSGSPFYNISTLQRTVKNVQVHFPIVYTYLVTIPLFPCGIWSFTLASKKWDPLKADLTRLQDQDTQYIDREVYKAAFALPKYVKKLVDESSS